jgi:hypothetical protein
MKLLRLAFLAVLYGVFVVSDANAKCITCDANYFFNDVCTKCMPGCYCHPDANGEVCSLDPWGSAQISDSEVAAWCANGTLCPGAYSYENYKECGRSDWAGIYRCPSGFPNSRAGAGKKEDCYTTVKCSAGKYSPAGSSSCDTSCEIGFYCEGKTYTELKYGHGITDNRKPCPGLSELPGFSYVSGTERKQLGDCEAEKFVGGNCKSGSKITKIAKSSEEWNDPQVNLTAKPGYRVNYSGDSSSCIPCGPGSYSNTEHSQPSCTPCPEESGWTSNTESTTATSHTSCYLSKLPDGCSGGYLRRDILNTGKYKGEDEAYAVNLQANPGYYVNGKECTICEAGYYSDDETATSCTRVDPGSCASSDGVKCIGSGKPGAKTWIKCPSGKYSNEERTDCIACTGADQYADNVECKSCTEELGAIPSGAVYFKASAGANQGKENCRYGILDVEGSTCRRYHSDYVGNKFAVVYKWNGTKYDIDSERTPVAKPAYYVDGDKCKKCTDYDATKPYSDGTSEGSKQCTGCFEGSCEMQNATSGVSECKKCSAGFACPGTDSGLAQKCSQEYNKNYGAFGVLMCPKGSFSKTGYSSCTECAVGYTTAKVYKSKEDKCSTKYGVTETGGSPNVAHVCCFGEDGSGCAITSNDEDKVADMCLAKETLVCKDEKTDGAYETCWSWPTGIKFTRPNLSNMKPPKKSNSDED